MVSGTTASQSGTHDGPRASWIKEHRRRATCLDRARRRSAAGRDVQLYLTQQESAAGASAAAVPGAIGVVKMSEVRPEIKVLKIDGRLPGEAAYSFRDNHSLTVNAKNSGAAQ